MSYGIESQSFIVKNSGYLTSDPIRPKLDYSAAYLTACRVLHLLAASAAVFCTQPHVTLPKYGEI